MPDCTCGWKIHVSIAREDVEKAWDAICPLLIHHGVYQTKVRAMIYEYPLQPGKEIVIYAFKSPGLDWNKILNEIEDALNSAHISPSPAVPHWRITVHANKGILGFRSKKEESIKTEIPELLIPGSRFLYCEDDTPVKNEAEGRAKVYDITTRADRGLFSEVTIIAGTASAVTPRIAGCKPPSGDEDDLPATHAGGGGSGGDASTSGAAQTTFAAMRSLVGAPPEKPYTHLE